jgi:hypothetical protein
MIIVPSLVGLVVSGFFLCTAVYEDKFDKTLLTYIEQFCLGSQFKESFPFPLGSRFFKIEMTKL